MIIGDLTVLLVQGIDVVFLNVVVSVSYSVHLYKLKKGISYVEGGLQVLSDLKFPQEIINSIKI